MSRGYVLVEIPDTLKAQWSQQGQARESFIVCNTQSQRPTCAGFYGAETGTRALTM